LPKTFPIMIEVEEIALGPVLRKLNEMPGIAKLHLDLSGGRPKSEDSGGDPAHARGSGSRDYQRETTLFLIGGEKNTSEIAAHLGGPKSRAYGATHHLKVKGIVENGDAPSSYRLTAKARASIEAHGKPPAAEAAKLPKPRASAAKANGKHPPPKAPAVNGKGAALILAALASGPQPLAALQKALADGGMSPKSLNGRADAMKNAGLIKSDGKGTYELTAKGAKQPTAEA